MFSRDSLVSVVGGLNPFMFVYPVLKMFPILLAFAAVQPT